MSDKRDRANELKVFLSDNEQYVLDKKVKASRMRNKSEYIRHLILYGYVYDIDYNGLKDYSYQIAVPQSCLQRVSDHPSFHIYFRVC